MINTAGDGRRSSGTRGYRGPIARLKEAAGGPARMRVILLLSGALALPAADQTIVGAVAPQLKVALGIGNTEIGLLVTAASLVAALTTLPFGLLTDRIPRVRLLAGCALAWTAAVTLAGFAGSYSALLVAQIALGAGAGAAGPLVASLVGDLFPSAARGRALSFILAAEFVGAASGLLIAGEISAVWSWRGSFWVLAAVGPLLAIMLPRMLPEPLRGGGSAVPDGATTIGNGAPSDDADAADNADAGVDMNAAVTTNAGDPEDAPADETSSPSPSPDDNQPVTAALTGGTDLADAVIAGKIEPRRELVLTSDPTRRSMRWAVRYVLSIPTNVVIIIASALGYFYVAGMQTFAIIYLRGRYDLGQGTATLLLIGIGVGVVIGTFVTGVVSDRLIGRQHVSARPMVGGLCFLLAVVVLLPGFTLSAAILALPLLFLGAACLGGVNPPLDAARLDIMHSRLWGRAESVRTFFQTLLKSSAPLLFGYLSTMLDGGVADDSEQGGGALGLERTFVILLVPLLLAGVVLLVARHTYGRDVATAMASEEAIRDANESDRG